MNPEVYKKELAEIKSQLDDPSIYSKLEYPTLAKRASELEGIVAMFDDAAKYAKQARKLA